MSAFEQLAALLPMRHPVVLAPMAGVGGGQLARAVSAAGGFGFMGGGYGDEHWLREQLHGVTGAPFGVGFITWALAQRPHLLQVALDAGARAILLSFGSARHLASQVRRGGAVLVMQVQTVAQAREAVAQGAQVIVAQGGEGGGHSGVRGTLALVPAVCDAVNVPVVAAGGVADGRGLLAVRALGAAAAMCGTAFYVAEESLAHAAAKQALVAADGDSTIKSPLFDIARGLDWPPGPWGLRSLTNSFTDRWGQAGRHELMSVRDGLRSEFEQARAAGDFRVAAVIAGEAADLVRKRQPARAIVEHLVAGANQLLQQDRGLAAGLGMV